MHHALNRLLTSIQPTTQSSYGRRPELSKKDKELLQSAFLGDSKRIQDLLSSGANTDAQSVKVKHSGLDFLAYKQQIKNVDILLKYAGNVNTQTDWNQTALQISALKGYKKNVEILLKHGANIDLQNYWSESALHLSAQKGHTEIVEILLKHGANIDMQTDLKQTALHMSARNGHKEIVEILLKHRANIDVQNYCTQSALHLSAQEGHKEIVEILLRSGANLTSVDTRNRTAAHLAARKGHKDIVSLLLSAGSPVNVRDDYSYSVLDYMNHQEQEPTGKLKQTMKSVTSRIIPFFTSHSITVETKQTKNITTCKTEEFKIDRSGDNDIAIKATVASTDGTTSKTEEDESLNASSQLPGPSELCHLNVASLVKQQIQDQLKKSSIECKKCEVQCPMDVTADCRGGNIFVNGQLTVNVVVKNKIIKFDNANNILMNGTLTVNKEKLNDSSDDDDDDHGYVTTVDHN